MTSEELRAKALRLWEEYQETLRLKDEQYAKFRAAEQEAIRAEG